MMKKQELRKLFLDIYPYTIGYYTDEDSYEYNRLVGMRCLLEAILGDTEIKVENGKLIIKRNELHDLDLFEKLNRSKGR